MGDGKVKFIGKRVGIVLSLPIKYDEFQYGKVAIDLSGEVEDENSFQEAADTLYNEAETALTDKVERFLKAYPNAVNAELRKHKERKRRFIEEAKNSRIPKDL